MAIAKHYLSESACSQFESDRNSFGDSLRPTRRPAIRSKVFAQSMAVFHAKSQGNQLITAITCNLSPKVIKFSAIARQLLIFSSYEEAAVLFLVQCD